jgi:hypothetical protein
MYESEMVKNSHLSNNELKSENKSGIVQIKFDFYYHIGTVQKGTCRDQSP